MLTPGRDGWTSAEVLAQLHSKSGSQMIKFRYDILRNGVYHNSVSAEGSISLNSSANIQRIARFTLYQELDWLQDQIKPYMLLRMFTGIPSTVSLARKWDERDALNLMWDELDGLSLTWDLWDQGIKTPFIARDIWVEFPLGVFIPSTPQRSNDTGLNSWSVEAYDRTIILVEDSITEPLYFAKGTNYLTAVAQVLATAGISAPQIRGVSYLTMPASRVFEPATNKKQIIDTLLSEINYRNIYCDANGSFIVEPYIEPNADLPDYTYHANQLSIISLDNTSAADFYRIPNVFIAMVSNPDIAQDFRSMWINDNPLSRLSTVRRGRRIVSEIYRPAAIPSQSALDEYIRRIAFQSMQIDEIATIHTALNPLHENHEVISILDHPDPINGTWLESSWTMPLDSSAQMTHTLRRLVNIV